MNANNFTPRVVHLTANENNSVTIRCRITCQDPDQEYIPRLRVVITEDGSVYDNVDHRSAVHYDLDLLNPQPNYYCNLETNVTVFEFQIMANPLSMSVNKSIIMCGLHYTPDEMCFSSSVAWIALRKEEIAVTTESVTSNGSSEFSTDTESSSPTESPRTNEPTKSIEPPGVSAVRINGPASISTITLLIIGVIILVIIIAIMLILQRRASHRLVKPVSDSAQAASTT